MKKVKYRIVTDNYNGFECQKWRWYLPLWLQINYCNTFSSIEKAKKYIENNKKLVVYEE